MMDSRHEDALKTKVGCQIYSIRLIACGRFQVDEVSTKKISMAKDDTHRDSILSSVPKQRLERQCGKRYALERTAVFSQK